MHRPPVSYEKLLEIGEASNTAALVTSIVDASREEDVVKLSALLDAHTENKGEITLLQESVYDGNHIEQTINMVGIWGPQQVIFPLHLSIRWKTESSITLSSSCGLNRR